MQRSRLDSKPSENSSGNSSAVSIFAFPWRFTFLATWGWKLRLKSMSLWASNISTNSSLDCTSGNSIFGSRTFKLNKYVTSIRLRSLSQFLLRSHVNSLNILDSCKTQYETVTIRDDDRRTRNLNYLRLWQTKRWRFNHAIKRYLEIINAIAVPNKANCNFLTADR